MHWNFKKVLSLFILIAVSQLVKANIVLKTDASRVSEIKDFSFLDSTPGLKKDMLAKLPIIEWAQHAQYTIMESKGEYYALRSCSFDVLKWVDTNWVFVKRSHNEGYNCEGMFFIKADTIFSIGNYGYWRKHSNIVYYDKNENGWAMIETKNQPVDYGGFTYLVGDSIMSVFGIFHNYGTGLLKNNFSPFLLNLKTKEWTELNLVLAEKYMPSENKILHVGFDLEDYFLIFGSFEAELGFLVFEKSTNKVFFCGKSGNFINESPFTLGVGNKLFYQFMGNIKELDFDKNRKSWSYIGEITEKKKNFSNLNNYLWIIIAIAVLLTFILVLRKRKTSNEKGFSDNIDSIIIELENLMGKAIMTEELDKILKLDDIENPDNKRVKRSKMIADINLRYKVANNIDLIMREKDEKDKRFVVYIVNRKK